MVDANRSAGGGKPGLVRRMLRIVNAFALVTLALVAGMVGYNAIDEDLTPEARALLAVPAMGAIDDGNAYVAFIGMSAPAGQDTRAWGRKAAEAYAAQAKPGFQSDDAWKAARKPQLQATKAAADWCKPEARACLALARDSSEASAKLLAEPANAELLQRYRRVREIPVYADLYLGTSYLAELPPFQRLTEGATLARIDIALKANAGEFDAALAELEREAAFHRRMAVEGRSIISVLIGSTLVARDLLLLSELIAMGGERLAPHRARVQALAGVPVGAGGLKAGAAIESHMAVVFAQQYRAMLRDGGAGPMFSSILSQEPSRISSWAASLLVRSNETTNLTAQVHAAESMVLNAPASGFEAARQQAKAARKVLLERPWYTEIFNFGGKSMVALFTPEYGDYAARLHNLEALRRMVALQAAIAERGAGDAAAIAAFVAGEGAKALPDPYTGAAFAFDGATRLLSFEPKGGGGSWMVELKNRHKGRIAIAL